jgi:hypothetical protein
MTDPRGTPPPKAAPAVLERQSWQTSTAPRYIAMFLWVVYFDQLGRRTLSVGGLMPSVLGALVAGLLCVLLLYHVPAMWGFRTGKPLTTLGTGTFGAAGSPWITGVLMALAQVVWLAVATYYATELTFQGLVSFHLMDPRALQPMQLGGLRLPNFLFLVTSLTWSYAAALTGHYLVQIIGALMNIFPIFMAVLLGVAMLSTLKGVPQFRPLEIDPATSAPIRDGGLRAFLLMIELIFGFFAPAGALAADWGAANRTERDVRLGGWIGVAFASWTVATLALLTVAGALGSAQAHLGLARAPSLDDFTFRAAVRLALGGKLAGTILLVFGLASLAPTCFAAYLLSHRFVAAWPGLKRIQWTLLGTGAAWLLIVVGFVRHLETIFALMGAAFAPMVGAMAADYVRRRGVWPGTRRGVNLPGLAAWAVGLAVGLVPILAEAARWDAGTRFQPAAVFAFLAAFVAYFILASMGAESPLEPPALAEPDASAEVEVA